MIQAHMIEKMIDSYFNIYLHKLNVQLLHLRQFYVHRMRFSIQCVSKANQNYIKQIKHHLFFFYSIVIKMIKINFCSSNPDQFI